MVTGQEQLEMPCFAWVGVTSRCNLDCGHCQRSTLESQGLLRPLDMPERIFRKLDRELFPHLKRVQFGGNNFGEPLLARNWDMYFDMVRKHGMRISMVSNARLLNPGRISALVGAGVEFNFSLEGATDESYARIRGYRFGEFRENVGAVCAERKRNSESRARVNLGFTTRTDNVNEIPQLMTVAAEMGVDRVTFTHFVPWREDQRWLSLVYHKALANKMFAEATRLGRELELLVDVPAPFPVNGARRNGGSSEGRSASRTAPCYHPWDSCSVDERGDVMPCCASSVYLGNLAEADFVDVWRGRRYQMLRQTVNSPKPLSFCANCGLRGIEVGVEESLSYCSDDSLLLGTIGLGGNKNSMSMARKVRNRLASDRWGKKVLPRLAELHRRYGAFLTRS